MGASWSISKRGLKDIKDVLDNRDVFPGMWPRKFNIVEFGSGESTVFLNDYIRKNRKFTAVSFENDERYMPKNLEYVDIRLRPLLTCDDEAFEDMFSSGIYKPQNMRYYTEKPHTRQRNCFYQIKHDDLPDIIDVLILDGPNGNGRSFAFLHAKGRLSPPAYVFIDDYDNYDFVERLGGFFHYEEIARRDRGKGPRHRDNYMLLEVI